MKEIEDLKRRNLNDRLERKEYVLPEGFNNLREVYNWLRDYCPEVLNDEKIFVGKGCYTMGSHGEGNVTKNSRGVYVNDDGLMFASSWEGMDLKDWWDEPDIFIFHMEESYGSSLKGDIVLDGELLNNFK